MRQTDAVTIELVPLCTATITLADPLVLPNTPSGTRVIVEVIDAVYEGERLSGKHKGVAAADWMTIGPEGTGTLDVRGPLETHDGALVYVTYRGRLDLSVPPGSAPTYAAPLYETGDERYAWLNRIQAVAKGTIDGQKLTYDWSCAPTACTGAGSTQQIFDWQPSTGAGTYAVTLTATDSGGLTSSTTQSVVVI